MNTLYYMRNVKNELSLESSIYKYIPLQYVLQMILNQELRFNPVSKWEDVYENFFLKARLIQKEGSEASAETMAPGVFGQSWTLLEESDAMWRIYSQIKGTSDNEDFCTKVAVRIRTTAAKLYNAIYLDDKDMANVYIGNVRYLESNDIDDFVSSIPSPLNINDINSYLVGSMFIKRNAFSHEQEVRPILIYANNQEQFGKDFLTFKIDPHQFIEEIVIDPRLRGTDLQYVQNKLKETGIENDKIRQSELYYFSTPSIYLE